jgi:hypothetical protein
MSPRGPSRSPSDTPAISSGTECPLRTSARQPEGAPNARSPCPSRTPNNRTPTFLERRLAPAFSTSASIGQLRSRSEVGQCEE